MSKYYNSITKELSSTPPWGNYYYSPSRKVEMFADWKEVDDNFVIVFEQSIVEVQNAKIEEINAAAAIVYSEGFTSICTGVDAWYDSDIPKQNEIRTAAFLAATNAEQFAVLFPEGFIIRSKASHEAENSTKVEHKLTAEQTVTLCTDYLKVYNSTKSKLWSLQSQVYAATTVSEVNTINW